MAGQDEAASVLSDVLGCAEWSDVQKKKEIDADFVSELNETEMHSLSSAVEKAKPSFVWQMLKLTCQKKISHSCFSHLMRLNKSADEAMMMALANAEV